MLLQENLILPSPLMAKPRKKYKVFWKRVSKMAVKVLWLKCLIPMQVSTNPVVEVSIG